MQVLVVSGYDYMSSNANAVCLRSLITEMSREEDVHIDVLGESIFEKDQECNSILSNIKKASSRIIHWPSVEPNAIKIGQEYLKTRNLNQYDFIVIPHKPYEAFLATLHSMKNARSKARILLYELDPMTNEIDQVMGLGRHLFFLSILKERMMYHRVDHVFHMECNREKYTAKRYQKFFKKFSYLDFPLLVENRDAVASSEKHDAIRLIYSGTLDQKYRNPNNMLNVMEQLFQHQKEWHYNFDIFSKGNCEETIATYSSRNCSFVQHGFVSPNVLNNYLAKSDFLISIGNAYSNMLPSKLITYIATGIPIIHFTSRHDDPCIEYLKKYRQAIVLYDTDSVDKNVNRLEEFIVGNTNIRVPFDLLSSLYIANTPKWSSEQIITYMMNK